jgi:ribosomal protein S18 acetylase RimI-like enzyme
MKIMTEYTKHSRFAYYNDIVIGAYTVRVEDFKGKLHAYILTFGVLEPYRKYGIGKQMMVELEKDIRDNSVADGIYLHMHVLNEVGKRFYESCGFDVHERLDNYYTDLEEPHCYVLLKKIARDPKPQEAHQ